MLLLAREYKSSVPKVVVEAKVVEEDLVESLRRPGGAPATVATSPGGVSRLFL